MDKPNNNHKKGFGSNPGNINRSGRPPGAKNRDKNTLTKSQLKLDEYSIEAVENMRALMNNDLAHLNVKNDVPMTVRMAAAKSILEKAIANESTKAPSSEENEVQEDNAPKVFSSAASKAS